MQTFQKQEGEVLRTTGSGEERPREQREVERGAHESGLQLISLTHLQYGNQAQPNLPFPPAAISTSAVTEK